uniref:Acyl carrier protein n=1 Tax=Candidatus Kentrum sp. FM TaxID=2126340 RepID=A0A450VS03_9GAMM|nr:MAG: acyl carrier protein [Candidatus Kentron sp. FM]VFJ47353.1 MAG: acyl carrier protein [Candidatus Kentron sp. FM]VFK07562.1 MAG: acyl carrier protein [Candidatus Kentron sp. FM]
MAGMTLEQAQARAKQRQEITYRLKVVLIERLMLPLEPDEIAEDSPLFGSGLGLDSVDALEIVVAVESNFGVSITDEDMQAFRSINTVVDFIEAKQGEVEG